MFCTWHIVICIPTARQRLGKHTPAAENARDNKTSIARQLISKHSSLTTEAVFSASSVQSGYKEVQNSSREVKSQVSRRRPARIWAWNFIVSSLRNWQLHNNGKTGVKLWEEDFMCDLKWQWDCYKSVARIRQVKTENPSACVTVSCKVCRSAIALYCLNV
jgi:hypothetical protein